MKITAISGNQITFQNEIKYMHFSGEYEGIEMRGEVVNLNRNVKISGEVGVSRANKAGPESLTEESPLALAAHKIKKMGGARE